MKNIEEQYIQRLSYTFENFKNIGNGVYNFRCPICGDSVKSKRKARGYLYPFKNRYNYKCHNCEVGLSFLRFMQYHNPLLYKEFLFDQFKHKEQTKDIELEIPKRNHDIEILSDYTQCSKLLTNHIAVKYLEQRKIPKGHYSSLFFCDDMNSLIQRLDYHDHLKKHDFSNSRYILAPFIDENGIVTYVMARSIDEDASFRYIMLKVSSDGNKIWGINNIDFNKPVFILEGVFDAMFLENSLATGSIALLSVYKYIRQKAKTIILIYDNDYKSNRQVFYQLQKAIEMNCNVVIFDSKFPFKDINQAIQSGWSEKQLMDYISSRTRKNLSAQLELTKIQIPKYIKDRYAKNKHWATNHQRF